MQLIKPTPEEFLNFPGFLDSLAEMRAEVELQEFSGPPSFNFEAYKALYDAGRLVLRMAHDNGVLKGWIIAMIAERPARAGFTMHTDAMWAKPGSKSGGLLLKDLIAHAKELGYPLITTAPVGGRLDRLLDKRARKTHNVYVIT